MVVVCFCMFFFVWLYVVRMFFFYVFLYGCCMFFLYGCCMFFCIIVVCFWYGRFMFFVWLLYVFLYSCFMFFCMFSIWLHVFCIFFERLWYVFGTVVFYNNNNNEIQKCGTVKAYLLFQL